MILTFPPDLRVAGVDEVGRGPLAGPVVAAAVVLPFGYSNPLIRDSKQLSAKQREELVGTIKGVALSWSIVAVGHHRVDAWNIREASRRAMAMAIARVESDIVLVDGNVPIDIPIPQHTIVGGDALYVQISAASILAKVWRDALMEGVAKKYPGYGFERHAGYPTKKHKEAIETLGPCALHRRTFKGVKEHLPPGKKPALDRRAPPHLGNAW